MKARMALRLIDSLEPQRPAGAGAATLALVARAAELSAA
jgi:hypothetical protein